jgi:hypothetical protein
MAQRPILERKNVFGARLIERRAAQQFVDYITAIADRWGFDVRTGNYRPSRDNCVRTETVSDAEGSVSH